MKCLLCTEEYYGEHDYVRCAFICMGRLVKAKAHLARAQELYKEAYNSYLKSNSLQELQLKAYMSDN